MNLNKRLDPTQNSLSQYKADAMTGNGNLPGKFREITSSELIFGGF